MKSLARLIAIVLIASLVINCSSKNAKGEPGGSNAGDSAYSGSSYLAYIVSGRHVAIRDYLRKGNNNLIVLFLNEVKNNTDAGTVRIKITNELTYEVFNFLVANKGRSNIMHYKPSLSNFNNKKVREASYMSPKYQNYYGDSVTVNITEIDNTHVAGEFSGMFVGDDHNASTKITDGKFDLKYTKNTTGQ
jgi:hypothetical protein